MAGPKSPSRTGSHLCSAKAAISNRIFLLKYTTIYIQLITVFIVFFFFFIVRIRI